MSHHPSRRARVLLLSGASLASLAAVQPAHAQLLSAIKPTVTTGGTSTGSAVQGSFGVAGPRLVPQGATAADAASKAAKSAADFNAAVNAVRAQLAKQAQARVVAAQSSSSATTPALAIPNGLGAGGLAPAAAIPNDPSLWQNAKAPTQATGSDGTTTVTIDQTAAKAILTWDSFNVGKDTIVHFDQTGGTQSNGSNDWIALNRVVDPSLRPSQILGQIKAEGSVYLINGNGIIFGGASQVDTHSLVASSLSFLGETIHGLTPGTAAYDAAVANSNATFLNTGIAGPQSTGGGGQNGIPNLVLGLGGQANVASADQYQSAGDVTIEEGAQISTHINGSQGNGGYVLIAGNNVGNAGTISTPDGQAILAAGQGVGFVKQATSGDATLVPTITGQVVATDTGLDATPISTLTNTGIVSASRGKIDLIGTDIAQYGVVVATTGVSYPGSITISALDERQVALDAFSQSYHRAGEVTFSDGSVTAMLPEEDGETATSSPTSTFKPGSITVNGGAITLQNGSLVEAPGANVSIAAQVPLSSPGLVVGSPFNTSVLPIGSTAIAGRVYIDNGATVDVAGLTDVQLAADASLATIKVITQNEIADDPNQLALLGLQNIVIDTTLAGTTADGKAWVGSPILNASGYAQLLPRKIDQLLVNAGSITLAGNEVLTADGSMLNLDGGYLQYAAGPVTTSRLVDSTGHMVAIGDANPNDTYVGLAGITTYDNNRWNVHLSWTNPLLAWATTAKPDTVVGGNAGTLTVYGRSAVVLDGAMSAQAIAGTTQVAAGRAPSGSAAGGSFLPTGGTFDLGDGGGLAYVGQMIPDLAQPGHFIVQSQAPQLTTIDPGFGATTSFDPTALGLLDPNDPNNVLIWRTIPADMLSQGGFANVAIKPGSGPQAGYGLVVASGATLTLQPGGSFSFKASAGGPITVLGSIIAPSGTINLETDGINGYAVGVNAPGVQGGDITIGPGGVLSTAGLWVNDSDMLSAPGASAFVNGGSVNLSAGLGANINLEQGSLIDVSSGGVLLASGLLSNNGVPVGKGGNVSLTTWNFHSSDSFPNFEPPSQPTTGTLALDGTILSGGFSGGGTLTLQALGFQIGGDLANAHPWDVVLPSDFFATQGFGNYQINALYDATVADGAQVRLTQQDFVPDLAALAKVTSGTSLMANGLADPGTLDSYHRQATNLTLTAGGDVAWIGLGGTLAQYDGVSNRVTLGVGAVIDTDAGASVTLGGTGGVTVLGTIRAPGGAITLTGDSDYAKAAGMASNTLFTTPSNSVWLGANAVLDASGVALVNPYARPVNIDGSLKAPTTGKVLNGGTVTVSDAAGSVVAEAGSVINVSGASATFDQPAVGADGIIHYASQQVWSDAGSITLGARAGLYFDGTLKAQGGARQAEGGTLTLMPESTSNGGGSIGIIIQQSGDLVPDGLAPGDAINPDMPGAIRFAADRLDGSGITTLVVGPTSVNNNSVYPTIAFAGDVSLNLGRAIILNTPELLALPDGAAAIPDLVDGTTDAGGASVSIIAPYVALNGPTWYQGVSKLNTSAIVGDATLSVNAGFLDLSNQLALGNFGKTNLTSSGDIRLSATNINPNTGNALLPGVLFTPGDLTLKAADLYPASGENFILAAVGPNPTTISFEGNGASSTPLSAGGALLVDATTIVQGGTIHAPYGSITLGVGDPTDSATQAAFGNLPLVATENVTLAAGSLTSVSAGDATLPYGVTTDGTNWSYPGIPNTGAPTLTAPPAKVVTLSGQAVSLDKGASVDLSGGGALQAEEWVPGTGGTRDLLSQYNISYAASTTGSTVPLYPDARNVYAVVPGYSAPAAAYDPVFAQNADPTSQGRVTSLGVGQAGSGDLVGKAVYLSNVPGLPAGIYTLLPAKYATLPGAFRVVQQTGAANVAAGQAATLADGTNVVAGYFADSLTGARAATPVLFDVQSAATWGKYSQYTLTDADKYFTSAAAAADTATPALPRDAGQLVLAATDKLGLGATLDTTPGKDGAAAQVDIASQDIQIVGSGEAALDGYLQIAASDLDALDAGSLLIGGTRSHTSGGTAIDVLANSVVVSTDAANPLTAPEILLVAKSDPTGTDPNAAYGLLVQSGSVITAKGSLPAGSDQTLLIGDDSHSGDGALLRVSNGAQVGVVRSNVGDSPQGLLTVAAGASVDGGAALTLDSSGSLSFDPAARFAGTDIAVDAPTVTFTGRSDPTGLAGFVVGPQGLAQFASAKQVDLRSFGDIVFDGDVALRFGQNVDLSAGRFTGTGKVTIDAPTIAFTNDLGAPTGGAPTSGAALAGGSGSLTVTSTEIDLGAGAKALAGFTTVAMTATGGIAGQGNGSFDMGAADTTLAAPVFLADTGSGTTLATTGALALNGGSGTALDRAAVGGALGFTGGSVAVNGANLSAPAGNLSLEATTRDLTIASGSTLSSAGVAKTFYDTTQYAAAGYIHLTADKALLDVRQGATLDFSGAQGGGTAGSLVLSGPAQAIQLAGTIKGNAASGYAGGSLSLDTGGAVDLDNLATLLASSGVNDALTVHSRAGNLTLSAGNTIKAISVALTADGGAGGQDASGGNILIAGTIDASGTKGGRIALYGKSGVDLEGALLATGSSATTRGGTVEIGTVGNADTANGVVQLDPTYGYELVSASNSGAIKLGDKAVINVSGGTAGGLSGGTVSFRAPLLADGDVNIAVSPTATVKGSRATTLEAFATWSTDDPIIDPARHFDGLVDPAGWYNADGSMVAGTWTDQSGNTLAAPTPDQLAAYLANDYFTPASANADHQSFYGYRNGDKAQGAGTLMGFVENLPIKSAVKARFANIRNFAVTPGIELDNPDPTINGGNITVLTNWNLGAGTDPEHLAYRLNGQAPTITFKAENDFQAKASLSDGFFQIDNPVSQGATIAVPSRDQYGTLDAVTPLWIDQVGFYANYGYGLKYFSGRISGPATLTSGDPAQISQYYALWTAYAQFLRTPVSNAIAQKMGFPGSRQPDWADVLFLRLYAGSSGASAPTPPSAAVQASDPSQYLIYLSEYANYLTAAVNKYGAGASVSAPVAPVVEPVAIITASTIEIQAVADNSPSPVRNASNPAPLETAALAGGASTSYRIVAGADRVSADPGALRLGSNGDATLDGHFSWVDDFGNTIPLPTMIRTGTGAIEVAAAGDIALLDQTAPGVIYAAGRPQDGTNTARGVSILQSNGFGAQDVLVTGAVNPIAAGDISITAGGNIIGVEDVTPTDNFGFARSQFWLQWMETGNVTSGSGQVLQSSINFGAFDQGIMSVGGNVDIAAGGNIVNLSASLPTSWYLTGGGTAVNTVGGGDLSVNAGGDILSGSYFVARGTGTIVVGGKIASSGLIQATFQQTYPVSTILATQDGLLDVSARQGADIGAVVNPSYLQGRPLAYGYRLAADSQSYSANSAVAITTTTGDISFNSMNNLNLIGSGDPNTPTNDSSNVLPATVELTAFDGGISIMRGGQLYPSAVGQLSLIADQSVLLNSVFGANNYFQLQFGMIDAAPSTLPSPLSPVPATLNNLGDVYDGNLLSAALIDHSPTPLHGSDTQPVRIYSLGGSIVDGVTEANGFNDRFLTLVVDKPAQIYAAQDIVNLDFLGQNLRQDDITRIVAGRDILATGGSVTVENAAMNTLNLGGPGVFDVEAGRNISLANASELTGTNPFAQLSTSSVAPSGIIAVGNASNPYLPHESASIDVLFGVGKGVDNAAFTAAYVDPAIATPDVQKALVAYMEAWDEGTGVDTGLVKDKPSVTLSLDQAWNEFLGLPAAAQQRFNREALFMVLAQVGIDYNDPNSPYFHQYARGYQAINTLFPASMGYTANSLTGGAQGALTTVTTGNLDLRGNTIQTQQGGDISILGPGGQALIGANAAPAAYVNAGGKIVSGPSNMGILTLEQGAINIFTDTSLLLAQSRIFTEQGGAIMIWSSNGDINAGKGSKTTSDVPQPIYVCDADFYCTRDARGEVTGAGIATLQTIPGAASADVETVAPRGTVDFGAAGVRSSGNLIVAAQAVLNAANVQVQGQTIGVPTQVSNVSANLSASSTAAAAAQEAAQAMQQSRRNDRPSIITITVDGFGVGPNDCDPNAPSCSPR